MIEIGRRQVVNVRDLGGLNKQVMSTFTGCATPTEETKSKKIIAAVDAYRVRLRHRQGGAQPLSVVLRLLQAL